ncbi:hypothetical protein DTO166G4_6378 [Paecilomyces variotii]|nr:hypothetical protein DTO166G4_6378 [Paecilomyces variotii]KAJ9240809.1 hypothetical protein DTO166G5_1618 [Paecilomyces variotii]
MPNPNFHLLPAKPEDIPTFADIFFSAFQSFFIHECLPDIPSVRNWWIKSQEKEFQDPDNIFLKIIEEREKQNNGSNNKEDPIVAFAKWTKPIEGRKIPPRPEWPEGCNAQLADAFFGTLSDGHARVMGERKHWFLALLGTRPLYEGQGAGSMLLAYGLRKADEEQVDAFLEASPPGEPLYLKHGFEVQERVSVMVPVDGQLKPYKNALMVRKPKPLVA